MILYSNAPKWAKALIVVSGILLFCAAFAYIAAMLFLLLVNLDYNNANLMTLYDYYFIYKDDEAVMSKMGLAAFGAIGVLLLPLALFFTPKKRSLHGDAKFAVAADIKKAGLFSEDGIIVGKYRNKYLIHGGSEHVLMAAPTRSGKGVGIVIPNLLAWKGSAVILDIKKENWDLTAGFRRKHGQQTYLFNPAPRDYKTHCWNPLFYISDDVNFRINDIQKIGGMLYPDVDGSDPIWSGSCRSLFLAYTLYLLETDDLPVTLGEIYRQATSGDAERYLEIFKEREEQGNPLSSECISAFNDYLDTSKNTRSSIRKTFTARLELWATPVIDAATSTNDFDLRDLRKKAMSIYVAITPDDLDRLAPITNLFFQQVIDLNIRELPDYENPDSEYKHQVLMLMDEFTSLGRLNSLFKGVSFIAGFGLRLLPIIQSPSQLRDQKLYGVEGANTFMENHALRIVFPPKDHKIAEEISNTLGFETVKSRSRSKQLSGSGGRSYSESDQRRALLLPQEITQLGARKALIILENCPPIKAVKIRYYEDPVFTQRLLDPPGVPEVTIKERQSGTVIDIAARTVTRAVTPEDVANIENMTLDDFSCEFSGIAIPTDNENLTDEELEAMANDFLNKITGEAA